jgi:hypothetical protein
MGFGPLATKDLDERVIPILASALGADARAQMNDKKK